MEKDLDLLILDLRNCLSQRLFFVAIDISLTIPDICSALESEDGTTDRHKYKKWVETYFPREYNGFIDASDIYKLRCASLHQGKFNHDNPKYSNIFFQVSDDSEFHCQIIGDSLILNTKIFVHDMIESRKKWLETNKSNPTIQENYQKSFRYYPNGLPRLGNVGSFIG